MPTVSRLVLLIVVSAAIMSAVAHRPTFAMESKVSFEANVRPILKQHCFHCHGEAAEKQGGLDLRLRRLIVAGGDSGPAVVEKQAEESLLLQRIRAGEMPPGEGKQLSPAEVDVIARWIRDGAITLHDEPDSLDGPLFTEEERGYWFFQPVVRPDVPVIAGETAARIRTPIDAFLLQAMQLHRPEATFAEDADPEMLVRRATFDLLGLPPVPEDVERFVADGDDDRVRQLIDRLLESPHYGERWGRHWL
ncbi:MAG: DUF1549 domain-containing protein, partial [Planctomycetaceae bacterium]|nr:DUF1549 domain-containing protein [Planctomycetaceae bacterium]